MIRSLAALRGKLKGIKLGARIQIKQQDIDELDSRNWEGSAWSPLYGIRVGRWWYVFLGHYRLDAWGNAIARGQWRFTFLERRPARSNITNRLTQLDYALQRRGATQSRETFRELEQVILQIIRKE